MVHPNDSNPKPHPVTDVPLFRDADGIDIGSPDKAYAAPLRVKPASKFITVYRRVQCRAS